MIRIDRSAPVPAEVLAALNKPLKGGQKELDAARAYYSADPPPKKAYTFRRYKEFEVCQALDSLFHGKCAYCESPYRAVDALDIEHFRPKGGVSEWKGHPGYWWLAAVWTNLLPSCPACNQRRRHVHYAPGMTLEEVELGLLRAPRSVTGKGNAFPVKANNWVAVEGEDLSAEDPLLINPCERNPDAHLEWIFDRNPDLPIWSADTLLPFIRPRVTAPGVQDEYATTSIAIYGLNRIGVIRDRAEHVKELQRASQPIVHTILDLAVLPDDQGADADKLRERLAGYKADLLAFAQPSRRYSGMASAYVSEFNMDLRKLPAIVAAT